MTTKSFAIEIPKPSGYGYTELKEIIKKHTWRSAILVGVLFVVIFLLYSFLWNSASSTEAVKMAPIVKLKLEDLPPPPTEDLEVAPPPPEQIISTGPAARAGTPVPVPDAEIKADLKEFATIDVQSRASAEGGDGVDLGNFASNIDWNADKKVDVQVREEEPAPDEFIPVEKQPATDFGELQRLAIYPELAKKAGIEGKVFVRALIGKGGEVKRTLIQQSDNKLLNDAAVDAVKKASWTPAIQNGTPVVCWVTVPITFKLR